MNKKTADRRFFYATFFSRSKHGQRLQRLFSPFLYFLQHLVLQLVRGNSLNEALLFFFKSFFFLPIF